MDSGKRASMREGPLSELFRRTDSSQEKDAEKERKPEPRPRVT